ncbi:hypothetical protein TgHK011_001717 [Trichoderma gracile]|nr:hypothetical protein TgHK011_001717 [Trichoderma gracile]
MQPGVLVRVCAHLSRALVPDRPSITWSLKQRINVALSQSINPFEGITSTCKQGEKGGNEFTPLSHCYGAGNSFRASAVFHTRTCANRVGGSVSGRQVHEANGSSGGTV